MLEFQETGMVDVAMRYKHHPVSSIKVLRCGNGCKCRMLVLISWRRAGGMGRGRYMPKCCGVYFCGTIWLLVVCSETNLFELWVKGE